MRLGRYAVAVILAACTALGAEGGGETRAVTYGPGRQLCTLANKAVNESSGMACGWVNEGVFWTNNDSGDKPRVYAFSTEGKDLGTFTLAGATARDWEDMASFRVGKTGYLLLADVGDNGRRRKSCTLYIAREPALSGADKATSHELKLEQTIVFKYEDGPHDCESVAIDPTGRTIYLVSKDAGRLTRVYELAVPKRTDGKVQVARAVATLKLRWATAMDISRDGRHAVVCTYTDAFEYTRQEGETWARAFAHEARTVKLPRRRQGESICYGRDGKTLYLTSEKVPTPLIEVPVAGAR